MMRQMSSYAFGVLVTVSGVLLLSPDSLLIRLAGDDLWAVAFWRSGCSAAVLALLHMIFNRFRPPNLTPATWALMFIHTAGSISFVMGVQNIGAANVLVILAATPLLAASFGWMFAGDRLNIETWLACFLGAVGVAFAAGGDPRGAAIFGVLGALIAALSLATQFVVLRARPDADILFAMSAGSAVVAVIALTLGDPLNAPWEQVRWPIVGGLIVVPFSFALITLGPRYLPAAEVSLLMLLEAVFGPLFVWLGGFESPDRAALIGGATVIAAVALMTVGKMRHRSTNLTG